MNSNVILEKRRPVQVLRDGRWVVARGVPARPIRVAGVRPVLGRGRDDDYQWRHEHELRRVRTK